MGDGERIRGGRGGGEGLCIFSALQIAPCQIGFVFCILRVRGRWSSVFV